MTGAYVAAFIAAIASIVTATMTALLTYRTQNRVAQMQTETQTRIAALQAETQANMARLQDELLQKKEGRQKVEKAEEVLAKYREPLVQAAFELQSRLYNIILGGVLRNFHAQGTERERAYTVENTLYVFAQYLAWTEIIRREVQFLNLGEIESTRRLSTLQEQIRVTMLASEYGRVFRIFRGEQRAIGEVMIVSKGDQHFCMGYAAFVEKKEPEFRHWFEPLRESVDEMASDLSSDNGRLRLLQHALVDLIDYLDPNYMRFDKERCKKA